MSGGLVIGAGCSRGCPAEELHDLIAGAIAPLDGRPVVLATIDSRADEPCITAVAGALGVGIRTYAPSVLGEIDVPSPSPVVAGHVGTPSVAEAAALLTAGSAARLLVKKQRSAHATCAVAREVR